LKNKSSIGIKKVDFWFRIHKKYRVIGFPNSAKSVVRLN